MQIINFGHNQKPCFVAKKQPFSPKRALISSMAAASSNCSWEECDGAVGGDAILLLAGAFAAACETPKWLDQGFLNGF